MLDHGALALALGAELGVAVGGTSGAAVGWGAGVVGEVAAVLVIENDGSQSYIRWKRA
jgi:hypothetical protein